MIKLIQGDCLEILPTIETGIVDCVLIDPPYFGIVKDDWDNQWKTRDDFIDWLEKVTLELKRILKSNGSLYIFADDKICAYVQVMIDKHLTLLNSIVWAKPVSMASRYAVNFRSYAPMTERILFYTPQLCKTGLETIEKEFIAPRNPFAIALKKARVKKGVSINQVAEYGKFYGNVNHGGAVTNWEKGYNVPLEKQWEVICEYLPIVNGDYKKLRLEYESLRLEYESLRRTFNAGSGRFDVITDKIITTKENTAHPTTKPTRLIKQFIEASTNKGGLVLDCFMGSGTTGVSCKYLDRSFIGIEKDPKWFKLSKERINGAEEEQQPDKVTQTSF